MSWQDLVLAVGNVILCLPLIPMLRDAHKPPLISSIPTGGILFIFACTLTTLHLWLAGGVEFIVSLQWLTLAYQKLAAAKPLPETTPDPHSPH